MGGGVMGRTGWVGMWAACGGRSVWSLWGPLDPSRGGVAMTAGWAWWACEAVEVVLGEACDGVDMGGWAGADAAGCCCCFDCSQAMCNIAKVSCIQYSTCKEYKYKGSKQVNRKYVYYTCRLTLLEQDDLQTQIETVGRVYAKAHLFFIFVLVLLYFWHSRSLLVRYQS
jgi:hypothetical protein